MNFQCSICEEASTRICVSCTKDTCRNHLCEKCASCSDCCNCEVRLEVHDSQNSSTPHPSDNAPVVRDRMGYDLSPDSPLPAL
jgi:hypothetical protein